MAQLMLRILHISDLHAGGEKCWWANGSRDSTSYTGSEVHTELKNQLEKCHPGGFNMIAVTGDLAEHANFYEFLVAVEFLKGLHEGLRCFGQPENRPYLCVVPGNHDVDREQLKQAGKKNERADPRHKYELKFKNFRLFISKLDAWPENDMIFDFERQFAFVRPTTKDEKENRKKDGSNKTSKGKPVGKGWCAIGLNSAVLESNLDKDHHGAIQEGMIGTIRQMCFKGFSPWEFRIALMHHQPVVVPDKADDLSPEGVSIAKTAVKSNLCGEDKESILKMCNKLKKAANYLHGSKGVLHDLERIGVQLVLTGHYHFGETQHYAFTELEEEGNPFGHGGITVLRAGSFGNRDRPVFHVVEVYKTNFRFNLNVYQHIAQLDGNGKFLGFEQLKPKRAQEYYCYSDRPNRVIDGLIRMLSSPTNIEEQSDFKEAQGTEKAYLRSDLYCGVKLGECGISPDRIALPSKPEVTKHHPLLFLDRFSALTGSAEEELQHDIKDVIWHQLCFDIMKNAGIYADLPHWSLIGMKYSNKSGKIECEFAESRYLHYLLLNIGLRKPVLRADGEDTLQSFRKKYLLEREYPRECSLEEMDKYLSVHRFLGLRTTFQVMFYVFDFYSGTKGGATFLKSRSNQVGHFEKQIQFPVGGGFKSALFGTRSMRDLQDAVAEETHLETGIIVNDLRCICLTVNTRTFCPAFTFLMRLSKRDFESHFEKTENKYIKPDIQGKSLVSLESWTPKIKPRDWWEGECLMPLRTDCRQEQTDDVLFTRLMTVIDQFFTQKDIRSHLDEYVGSSIELYSPSQ